MSQRPHENRCLRGRGLRVRGFRGRGFRDRDFRDRDLAARRQARRARLLLACALSALCMPACGRVGFETEGEDPPPVPVSCKDTGAPLALGCFCEADADCDSGRCMARVCCEDACDDACTGCNARGRCEARAGQLAVSKSPDRAMPVALRGQRVAGPFYAFADTCEAVDEVRFHFDQKTPESLEPLQIEIDPPYDFGGDAGELAGHHSTVAFPKGTHTLIAELVRGGSVTAVLQESFELEPGALDESLVFSLEPQRSDPQPLAEARVAGALYPFLAPGPRSAEGVPVTFYLDDPERKQPVRIEDWPPYDLGGGYGAASAWDSTTVTDGSHVLEAVYVLDGVERSVSARFDVANAGPSPGPSPGASTGPSPGASPGTSIAR